MANTSPAGVNQSVQFNDNGSFGANNSFSFDTGSGTLYVDNLSVGPGVINAETRIITGGDITPYTTGQNLGSVDNRWYNIYVDGGIYASGSFGTPNQILISDGYGTVKWMDAARVALIAQNSQSQIVDLLARETANSNFANINYLFSIEAAQNTAIAGIQTSIQSVYNYANTIISGGSAVDQVARNQANTLSNNVIYIIGVNDTQNNSILVLRNYVDAAFNKANAANILAQAAFNTANTANIRSTLAYNQANDATTLAQAAYNKANAIGVFVQSNVESIIPGASLGIAVDYNNLTYPGGVYTVFQQGPVSFIISNSWITNSSATKDAYSNNIANIVNTSDVRLNLSLSNATFNIQNTDTLVIGDRTFTGANLISLGITGSGGIYNISSGNLSSAMQISPSVAVSANLTTTRVSRASNTGTTLVNTQPTPFGVVFTSGAFANTTVPFFNTNQTFTWAASSTGTISGGVVTYAPSTGGSSVNLTTTGATSGTSGSIPSDVSYIITSTNTDGYRGAGLNGAGTRTIPTTITRTIPARTIYRPVFYKTNASSSNPNFTTSDTRRGDEYALGQGATTTSVTSNYLWIAIPGSDSHTFGFTFLQNLSVSPPDVTYLNQTIGGYPYNVYGFTNYNAPTYIYTIS